ncbi:hypothetical protein [Abiotrophia defectiva]
MENNNELIIAGGNITAESSKFQQYLNLLNLPSENIIAETDNINTVISALPNLLSTIPLEKKNDATYLSKFVAASAIGLFDAALNYVWNEVVINLREKIIYYGLETFYANALGGKPREEFKTDADLSGIKDKTLLDTCKKLEWISDINYRKLCHILDMRNQIGASHPNISTINPYELLGWLEVCVKDVINDQPSASAVNAKKIIENIKKIDTPIDTGTLNSLERSFKDLSTNISSSLLVTLFGIYVSEKTSQQVRNNILSVSSILWEYTTNPIKYELGTKKEYYKNNLDKDKEDLAYTFFEKCNGLDYLTINEKSLTISGLCDDLYNAAHSWDNYYNEPPIAREIMKYIKSSESLPEEQTTKLLNTFLECRIGREVPYQKGVSPGAKKYYDSLFKLLSKNQVKITLELLKNHLDSFYDNSNVKSNNVKEILVILKSNLIGERLNEIIDFLIDAANKKHLHAAYKDKNFKDLCRGIINIE